MTSYAQLAKMLTKAIGKVQMNQLLEGFGMKYLYKGEVEDEVKGENEMNGEVYTLRTYLTLSYRNNLQL